MTRNDEHRDDARTTAQAAPARREVAALDALRAANPVPRAGDGSADGTTELSAAERERKDATLAAIFAGEETNSGAEMATSSEPAPGVINLADAKANREEKRAARGRTENHSGRRSGFSRWSGAAAAAVVLLAGAVTVPALFDSATPSAQAAEILQRAGDAAAQRPSLFDVNVLGKNYQHRIDEDSSGRIVTSLQIDASNTVTSQTTVVKDPGPELSDPLKEQAKTFNGWNGKVLDTVAQLNESGDGWLVGADGVGHEEGEDSARAILEKLTLPGVNGDVRKKLFEQLANKDGNEVAVTPAVSAHSGDEVVTIERPLEDLSVSLLPSTGQVIAVEGLVGHGVTTTIDAIGILGCVSIIGQDGPEEVSLACADQNNVLRDLKWNNWNAPEATATGTAWVNDCDPSCADDAIKPYPVKVKVSRQQDCGYNLNVYTRLDVTYLDAKPETEQRTEQHQIGCSEDGN